MLLRKFTWVFVFIVLAASYTLIDYQVKHRVILKNFMALEKVEAHKDMARCLDAIKREIHHLKNLASDWAVWDDTYRFAQDGNETFIESTLEMETLEENGGINLIAILNTRGERVWGKAYRKDHGGEITVGTAGGPLIDRLSEFYHQGGDGAVKEGLVLTDHGPMFVVALPIFDTLGQGPSSGTFIMGRFMTKKLIASLVEQTKVDFDVKPLGEDVADIQEQAVLSELEHASAVLLADQTDRMKAYGLLMDIYDRPALLVTATLPRPIMERGRHAARYVSLAMMAALIFCVVFLFFMSRAYVRDERRRRSRVEALVEKRTHELKLANEGLEQARVTAVEASKAKSQFLANMSHEIRTPLNGIIGMAEIALSRVQDERQRDILETINRESQSLLGIINSILDFSKIEAGKVELEAITFDLRLLLSDIGKSISFLAERKGLTCEVMIAPETPQWVSGDPGRLRQVLMNLTGNSLKFTDRGGLTIRCEAERLDETALLRFSVSDSGIGIAGDKREKIFESFTQADGSTTRKYGGTGLGISISKQLVELMGGRMGLESEEGRGSTFWFRVPLTLQKSPRVRPGARQDGHPGILVVGGCADTPPEYTEQLRDLGYTVETRVTGQDALNRLRNNGHENVIQLMMIESCLEDTDGFVLAETIRSMESVHDMPIILTTRSGAIGDGRRCQDIGIKGYLHGSLSTLALQHAIQLVMGADPSQGLITRHTIEEMLGSQARILLVDDYPTNRQVAMNLLTLSGYEVDLAENGQQAVTSFLGGRYAVILMDVQMPVLDGFEATQMIREHEAAAGRSRTPIIAMTANAMADDRTKCLAAGMDDFISKPVTRQALLPMIAAWISGTPGAAHAFGTMEKTVPAVTPEDARFYVMDFDRALDEFMGDRAVLMAVLAGFHDQGMTQVSTLRRAVNDAISEVVADEAHKIKGGAANLAMDRLAAMASRLETAARAGSFDEAPALIDAIAGEFDRLADVLAQDAAKDHP